MQTRIEDYAHLYGRAVNSTYLLDSQLYCDRRAIADAVTAHGRSETLIQIPASFRLSKNSKRGTVCMHIKYVDYCMIKNVSDSTHHPYRNASKQLPAQLFLQYTAA